MDELHDPVSPFKQLLRKLEFTQSGSNVWESTSIEGYVLTISTRAAQATQEPFTEHAPHEVYHPRWERTDDHVRDYPEKHFYTFEGAASWLVDYLLHLGVR